MKKVWFILLTLVVCAALQFTACEKSASVDLPQSVLTYISTNHPGFKVDESEKETLCTGGTAYEVEVENSNDDEMELVFDTEGKFLYSESEIAAADLPATVKSGIDAKYPGFKIQEADKLTMADGSFRYEVDLKNGGTQKEVLFDTEGAVICEQDED